MAVSEQRLMTDNAVHRQIPDPCILDPSIGEERLLPSCHHQVDDQDPDHHVCREYQNAIPSHHIVLSEVI